MKKTFLSPNLLSPNLICRTLFVNQNRVAYTPSGSLMKYMLILILSLSTLCGYAQTHKYSTFYEQRASLFEELPICTEDIVFIGNSITNGGEWHELFENRHVKNRGISGDTSEGVYDRLDAVLKGQPRKLFLLIGINDIAKGLSVRTIATTIEKIVSKIQTQSSSTSIYLQSVLPVNPDFGLFSGHMKPDMINELNVEIKHIAQKYNITYIDLHPTFLDQKSHKLDAAYTNDGLHLMGKGYILWRDSILSYVNH